MSHQIDELEPRDVVAKKLVLRMMMIKYEKEKKDPPKMKKRPKSDADFDWIRFLYRFRCGKNIWIFFFIQERANSPKYLDFFKLKILLCVIN
jgi:hypothetical protein